MISAPRLAAVLLAVALTAAPAAGQTASVEQIQLNDLRGMKDKVVGLANAIPEGLYEWRPMVGVRSVEDVLILFADEGNRFPTQWGAPPRAGVSTDRAEEQARLAAMSKAELAVEVGLAFDNMIAFVAGLDAAGRAREIRFFGQQVTVGGAIMMAAGDMHEHLGQLIAYARSNRVVPPWSA
jgi:hypothetical protein